MEILIAVLITLGVLTQDQSESITNAELYEISYQHQEDLAARDVDVDHIWDTTEQE